MWCIVSANVDQIFSWSVLVLTRICGHLNQKQESCLKYYQLADDTSLLLSNAVFRSHSAIVNNIMYSVTWRW